MMEYSRRLKLCNMHIAHVTTSYKIREIQIQNRPAFPIPARFPNFRSVLDFSLTSYRFFNRTTGSPVSLLAAGSQATRPTDDYVLAT